MEYRTLTGRLFRAGNYVDRGLSFDVADLDRIVKRSNTIGNIVMDVEHADTEQTIDTGYIRGGSLRVEDDWIVGDYDVPEGILPSLKARGISVVLDVADSVLRKATITSKPRVAGAAFSADQRLVEFAVGEMLMSEEQAIEELEAPAEEQPTVNEALGAALEQEHAEEASQEAPAAEQEPEAFADQPAEEAPEEPEAFAEAHLEQLVADRLAEAEQRFTERLAAIEREAQAKVAHATAEAMAFKATALEQEAVSRGVPPSYAKLLAPYAAKAGSEAFSEADAGFAKVASEVLDMLAGTVKFSASLPAEAAKTVALDFDSSEFGEEIEKTARAKAAGDPNEYRRIIREEYDRARGVLN